ncbi:MAG: IclR family transcriptional regulator [Rhodospirillaceae bacterium]|jgi:DNA-binding IclR family transcriptional regulator|nr:IclR family transcriptional regulator [Rhodospirillaceae bacterium]MBT4938870.1 IclR family transcriptional regulator [Rhodospirillaceae bacterium]MBT5938983.1 IclR family transcriptional regulator [Rhodospirillaceae bacterium]MBT7267956.1 IclR family transcriptional regulator [Rhodospirillaceae bacterium]
MSESSKDTSSGIRVISRAAEILRTLNDESRGLSLGQIAAQVNLPRSTVQRIVGALKIEGFIIDGPGESQIRIGPAFFSIAAASLSDFKDPIRPYLEELCGELNETVDLSILSGSSVVFLDQCSSRRKGLVAVSEVGARFPAHSCAPGKCLLAEEDESDLAHILPPDMEQLTKATITDIAALKVELNAVRERGVAIDRQEHTDGISAVSTAIIDLPRGTAAISIPMPTQRFEGNEERHIEALLTCRGKINHALGLNRG